MIQNVSLAKGTIPFVLVFSLLGVFLLVIAGSNFYHWYSTGNLYFPAKYSDGVYTSYDQAPGLFVAAVLKNLLVLAAGLVSIIAAWAAPSYFRKKEQARLAEKKAQPSGSPWAGPNTRC
ncbi:minor structural protein 3 [Bradyrhizobium oligotrophicum S58]|uniref:Minor structural protein 3 n=1 Tax=Bradyrhizobium oligotrophicum S58 TaxID=1245469 RepID=M4ZCU2_9BRAD|nr:hypothetical protein [Bradyrhizobium oligotrophicum]BAM91602.1 minor structural protein 3 [Bradyrhizobium oligotrophicum S58]